MRFAAVFRAAAAAFLMLSVSATAADAPLAAPTAADFGALPFLSSPKLSPDGRRYVAHARAKGKRVLMIVDLDATAEDRLHIIALPDKQQAEWVRWAGNGKLLISLSFSTIYLNEEARGTRLLSFDLATSKLSFVGVKTEGLFGDRVIHIDPDGAFVLLNVQETIYEYPSVFRIDLATGRSREIVKPRENVWDWYADAKGVVRAGVGSEGNKWWVFYRADEGQDFARTAKREWTSGDQDVDKFLPISGSDTGYAIAAGKNGRFGLYRYDFLADKVGDAVYENDKFDIDDFDTDETGAVRAIYYTDDRARVEWFDPDLKKLQAKIDRALPGTTNRVVSTSRDAMRMLVWSGSASDPGTYYLYDRKLSRMDATARPYESLIDKQLAPMQSVTYKARDGVEVPGYLTLPPGKGDKNLPLVVMPHGGPFVRDEWGYDPWVQFLASKGYAVLQPNYRGSTGYGRAYVELGNGQFGRGMQDDVDDGVRWLADRGTVDAKRVCIMGASYGGYAAMLAATRNPEIYRCAISFAGLSDVAAQLRYDRRSFAASRYFRDWRQRVQGDKSFVLDTISPLKRIDTLTVPLLIAHGSDDDNVPLFQSRRLHEALDKLGRKHEYVVYPGEGHGFADPKNSTDFLTRVGAFLDKHNPS